MYESPINILEKVDKISNNFGEKLEKYVMEIVSSYGVEVDKEELVKALKYDRDQYDKGFKDGFEKGKAQIIHCKDCEHWKSDEFPGNNDVHTILLHTYPCKTGITDPEWFCGYGKRNEEE